MKKKKNGNKKMEKRGKIRRKEEEKEDEEEEENGERGRGSYCSFSRFREVGPSIRFPISPFPPNETRQDFLFFLHLLLFLLSYDSSTERGSNWDRKARYGRCPGRDKDSSNIARSRCKDDSRTPEERVEDRNRCVKAEALRYRCRKPVADV